MKKLSVSLSPEHVDRLDERQGESGIGSRSEALREILDEYDEIHTECERLRAECEDLRTEYDALEDELEAVREERDALQERADRADELETEVNRLRQEKRQILEERREKKELVRYVEDERTTQQRWRQASIVTRAKWRLLGMPESET